MKINQPEKFVNSFPIISKFNVNYGYKEELETDIFTPFSLSPLADSNISSTIDLRKRFKEISQQYNIGSCVANAIADTFEYHLIVKHNIEPEKQPNLSRLFIYWNARNLETPASGDIDNGTRISLAFHSISLYGTPTEDQYPYEEERVNRQPSYLIYKAALKNRIKNFYKITSSGEDRLYDVIKALSAGHPVVFATVLMEEFKAPKGVLKPPSWYQWFSKLGNHAMVIVGWDSTTETFIIRNSWGPEWGDNGHCYMHKDYIKSQFTRDLWVIYS